MIKIKRNKSTMQETDFSGKSLVTTKDVKTSSSFTEVKKPSPKAKSLLTTVPITSLISERDSIKNKIASLESRLDEVNAEIKERVTLKGAKDDKGSLSLNVEVDGKERFVMLQARKKVTLDAVKAESVLKELKLWKDATDVIPVHREINEDYLSQLISQEKLSMKSFEDMINVNTTYALVVDPVKEEDYKHNKKE